MFYFHLFLFFLSNFYEEKKPHIFVLHTSSAEKGSHQAKLGHKTPNS